VIVVLLVALVLALLALAGLIGALYRVSLNVGPLNLEDYASRHDCIYLPMSKTMAAGLGTWSKPIRIRVDAHHHPLLGEFVATYNLTENAGADV
jgi:hypothetical protein